jgi:hypothetical protein
MPSRQGIATDQLINVIQVLQLGRKTGELTAERQIGPQIEVGVIKFVRGQVTFAQCGQLSGQSALHSLQIWGQCRFVFTNATGEKNTGPLQHNNLSVPNQPMRQDSSTLPALRAVSPARPSNNTGSLSARPSNNTGSLSARPSNNTGSLAARPSNSTGSLSSLANLVPRRMFSADEGMYRLNQANPSRLHRHLYQLINNQRSCAELVRLVNRHPEEVLQILGDLERVGIIQLY